MRQTIRALLIEDNRIEAHQTRHWLASSRDVAIEAEWVEGLAAGLERLSRGGIDVVLLDLNLSDSRGLETFTKLNAHAPGVPVVVLTGEHDESVGILAVQQGAEDYLVKQQVEGGKLAQVVHFAVLRRKTQLEQFTKSLRGSTGRIISLWPAKGGVGATTVAINVGTVLAEAGKSVIIAELQPTFGGMAFALQRLPTASLSSLLEVPPEQIGGQELSAVLCPGPAATRLLFGCHAREICRELDVEHVEPIVKGLSRLADYVILDLPSWPSAAATVAASLSQYVGVVVDREPVAVQCGQTAVAQLRSAGLSVGALGAIVVGRTILPLAESPSSIQSRLGCPIVRMIPPATEACGKANQDGLPVVLGQPQSDIAGVFVDLAHQLADDRRVMIQVAG